MKEIIWIDETQAGKLVAIFLGILLVGIWMLGLISILYGVLSSNGQAFISTGTGLLLISIVYVAIAYFITRFFCWFYNRITGKYGGFKYEVKTIDS